MRTSDRVYYIRLSEKTQGLVLNIYALLPGNGKNFPAAPNQHHPLSNLRREPGNTGFSLLPVVFSHIHSKTACRGFKSFCPCQKSQVSLLRYLTFSLVCGRIWQRGAPAGPPAVRVVGRWSPVATVQRRPRRQPRPSPSFYSHHTMGEFHPLSPVRTCCTPLQHPKRTRFRLFLAFPGTFRCFCPLLTCKIFGSVFVHPAA